jgi:uncharacterized protein with PQ loop repeat
MVTRILLKGRSTVTSIYGAIFVAMAMRLGIYFWLHHAGYFYGIPWDSFARTLLSYDWSQRPFFSASDGYWLPFQFWTVGSIYILLKPLSLRSEILVPVVVNNLFLIGSLAVTYLFGQKMGGRETAFVACLLAGIFSGDVFISYTALSEPMLVFFILLASYFIYEYIEARGTNRAILAIKIAIPCLLAAATHYIGWFLAIFTCLLILPGLFYSTKNKDWKQVSYYLVAIALCALMPIAWLLNSFRISGNLFQSAQIAGSAQSGYIGKIPLLERIPIPAIVFWTNFPALTITGILALGLAWAKQRRALAYIAAPAFILGMVWVSTALAFSAPYQEPRYLVFWAWATIPFIAFAGQYFWREPGARGKALVVLSLALILFFNLKEIHRFRNSFDPELQKLGLQVRRFIQQNPESAQVVIEDTSDPENSVIQVISGYPDRFVSVKPKPISLNNNNLGRYFSSISNPWLAIVQKKVTADKARKQGLSVNKIDHLFLISSDQE